MSERQTLPVLALRNFVLFPGVAAPIQAGRPRTLKAIEVALASGENPKIFAVSQREPKEDASAEDLHTIGTVARIVQIQRGLNGMQLLIQGEARGIAVKITEHEDGYFQAVVRDAEEHPHENVDEPAFAGLYREAREKAAELGERSGLPGEVVQQLLSTVDDPGRLADLVAGYSEVPHAQKQMLLETLSVEERLRRVLVHVQRQINVMEAQEDIKSKVQEEIGGRQREMFLREQLKAIQKELGEDGGVEELEELREKLAEKKMPESVRTEVDRELGRLGRMNREAMESQVIRSFLETIAELPWNERSADHLELTEAERILDEDHYGLEDVKDRVLEFLAVRQLREARRLEREPEEADEADEIVNDVPPVIVGEGTLPEGSFTEPVSAAPVSAAPPPGLAGSEGYSFVLSPEAPTEPGEAPVPEPTPDAPEETPGHADEKGSKGPILLFVGPPGVGKTSVAKSIARSMGRKYVRVSLGGVRDEADIRGHRRTYVGAMPGRIIQGMRQAGTKNPVFLLDEVDKLGASYQGDPASALLEVLDPAQNDTFTDHYLGVPYDLSEVLFIATANFIQNIPGPLLDRMEVVEFSGYTEREKLEIAKRYLSPRQIHENGLSEDQIEITEEAVQDVISRYTREAGVRQLERSIGKLCRKVARQIAVGETERVEIGAESVSKLLGRPKVHPEKALTEDKVGIATGMYYTPTGGDIMFVEASPMKGKGELVLTGQLGDVMKESARAALTYAKAHAESLGIPAEAFDGDVHVHVPAGAIPKDGPSAGVTMATALVSALSGRPVRHDVAMTGEVTLSGRVLPIGGLKEKILGAVRAGTRKIIVPKDNESHLEDLTQEVRDQIEVYPTEELGEVLALTLRGATFREGRLFFGDDVADASRPALHH